VKLAIVHDYLNQFGGAERVVGVFHEMFPEAPIFTSFYIQDRTFPCFRTAAVSTSFMQQLPRIDRYFRSYLPLYPLAFENFDLKEYDVVLSSSSGWAHGIQTRNGAIHICYCYTPPRWVWNFDEYVRKEPWGPLKKAALRCVVKYLRQHDLAVSRRPHYYIAISNAVAHRIKLFYGRESTVIHPPVEVERFPLRTSANDYYLVVSRINGYKRIDLVVEAFNELKLPLRIVGEGPMRRTLEQLAGPNIQFLGVLKDSELVEQYANCRALIFPGEEDFGIAPLEANACGRPVIAFAAGGALETVLEGETGIFFRQATASELRQKVLESQRMHFDPHHLRAHAEKFGTPVFRQRLTEFLRSVRSGAPFDG